MADSIVHIADAARDSADAIDLMRALDDDLRCRYPGIEPRGLHPGDGRDRQLVFLIAYAAGRSIGCAAVRELDSSVGEVKRMFVRPAWRGRGVARQLLAAVESHARGLGYVALRLETAIGQPEAIGLYRSSGFTEIPAFGEYIGNPVSMCFEKRLSGD